MAAAIYAAILGDTVSIKDGALEYEKEGRRYRLPRDGRHIPV